MGLNNQMYVRILLEDKANYLESADLCILQVFFWNKVGKTVFKISYLETKTISSCPNSSTPSSKNGNPAVEQNYSWNDQKSGIAQLSYIQLSA